MDHKTQHQADAGQPVTQDFTGAPWRERAEAFETPLVTWLESGEDSAAIARRLIRGHTLLNDEQARVSLARLAFFAGQQAGVALAQGDEMQWRQTDDGRSEPTPERQRDAEHASTLAGVLLLLVCIAAFPFLGGCASTNTVLRVGVHADITDITSGCKRNVDPGCGLLGPREVAKIELMWAPSVRPGPYCSISDDSHYSAGFPFNGRFEGFVHTAGCGGFFQFGGRQ